MTASESAPIGPPAAGGPPCDICQDEPAVMSVMNLADYSQLTVGARCLLPWLRGMVGSMTEAEPAADGAQGAADATPAEAGEPPTKQPDPPAAGRRAPAGRGGGRGRITRTR